MKTTFTPGPWRIRSLQSEGHDIGFANNIQIATVPDPNGFGVPVAMVCYNAKDRREANAAIIAAAPDLLAALESACNVMAAIVTGVLGGLSPNSPALIQARAAIAKARGESC